MSHSPIFGVMADGIPIYGPYGDGGKVCSLKAALDGHDVSESYEYERSHGRL